MSHKCARSGCAFHLPDTYPFPLCPWHLAPGKGIVKFVSAIGLLGVGVGGAYAFDKVRDLIKRKRTEKQQDEWRKKSDDMRNAKDKMPDESDGQLGKTG